MTRTKLRDRLLPDYTHGEELVNMISHIVGGGLGVLVLFACLFLSIRNHNVWGIVGSAVYGVSFIQLYTISSIYHGLRPSTAKKVLQIIDHCSIYLFIAGTYTPIMLCSLRPAHPAWAWSLLGVVWGIAALAITLNAIDLKNFAVFSMICYIGMGWCVIAGIKPVLEVLPSGALWLLVLGGVVYTLGAVAYGLGKKKRYMHSLFHICCLGGSVLQALCIIFYVL
ncbi:MAG: hemolysin III family protein [Clostridia bacterium]|nr:hemolysin III family protein [Clostridia bacterium]